MDVEKELRRVLVETGVPAPVFLDVPGKRPGEFYSLELTGESSREGGALRSATVAVQCWAKSRMRARELLDALQSALPTVGYQTGRIGRATLEGGYRFDDLASGTPRYQAVLRVTY